jgi:uncharacterized protein (TIGR00251 family)
MANRNEKMPREQNKITAVVPPKSRSLPPPAVPPAPPFLVAQGNGVRLSVKVQPRASANEIGEPLGNELKVKVTAPPVDAAANEALLKLLAEKLDCARQRVELIRGHTSRHKIIFLHGFSPEQVRAKLLPSGPEV